jgi:hypothetical protein
MRVKDSIIHVYIYYKDLISFTARPAKCRVSDEARN